MTTSTSSMRSATPASIDGLEQLLAEHRYIADDGLATAIYLALKLRRPLLLEGEAGVGKTEVAKVLSAALGADLIRLQCYEGLDVTHAVYEWNYARQLIEIRLGEAAGEQARDRRERARELFGPDFLIERPLLQALRERERPPVLLIDELDRADEEFEGYLLELLSDFQITIPETRDDQGGGAAGRRHHVQPHPRAARRPQAALRLRLDRLPQLREGAADHHHEGARGAGRARRAGDRLRAGAAAGRPLQGDRRVRDAGLGGGTRRARQAGARRGDHRPHARHRPQDAGRPAERPRRADSADAEPREDARRAKGRTGHAPARA